MGTISPELSELIEKNTAARQEMISAFDRFNESLGGTYNTNTEQNLASRSQLPYANRVKWINSGVELEKKVWEHSKEYELSLNPKQENLSALIDMFISQSYDLTISDPHLVLSLPTEKQSFSGKWFVGWDQELHIHAKKLEEEVLVKKEVVWYGPITFWCTGVHYEVHISKNKSQIDDKVLLNLLEYGELEPKFRAKMAKPKNIDGPIFERWTHDYVDAKK